MTATVYGSKYDSSLDIAVIAKLVRADIKAAIKAGELPAGIKVGVTISRFAGGRSLDAKIKAMPGHVLNPARVKWEADNPHAYPGGAPSRHSAAAKGAVEKIKAIVDAYNYDGSDLMTDYFHVNFYGGVEVDWEFEAADKAAIIVEGSFDDLSVEADAEPADRLIVGPGRPGMSFEHGDVVIETTLHDVLPSNVIPFPVGGRRAAGGKS